MYAYTHASSYSLIHTYIHAYIFIYKNYISPKFHPETQNLFKETADYVLSFEIQLTSLKVFLQ